MSFLDRGDSNGRKKEKTLNPDVQNFVPRVLPTNDVWSSNHASDLHGQIRPSLACTPAASPCGRNCQKKLKVRSFPCPDRVELFIVLPGWVCVVRITVLEHSLLVRPLATTLLVNAPRSTIWAASSEGIANSKMSPANSASNSGLPWPRPYPHVFLPAHACYFNIVDWFSWWGFRTDHATSPTDAGTVAIPSSAKANNLYIQIVILGECGWRIYLHLMVNIMHQTFVTKKDPQRVRQGSFSFPAHSVNTVFLHALLWARPRQVKHHDYDYDLMETWEKYGPKWPQNAKRNTAEHAWWHISRSKPFIQ